VTDLEKRKAAIDAVARALINRVVDDAAGQQRHGAGWEDYPDLGQLDFEAVLARARRIVDGMAPSPAGFTAAYEHLAEQARGVTDV
jgi:hypothetical protein